LSCKKSKSFNFSTFPSWCYICIKYLLEVQHFNKTERKYILRTIKDNQNFWSNNSFWQINITGCVAWSPSHDLAVEVCLSLTEQKNKPCAEQEPCLANGCVVNNKLIYLLNMCFFKQYLSYNNNYCFYTAHRNKRVLSCTTEFSSICKNRLVTCLY